MTKKSEEADPKPRKAVQTDPTLRLAAKLDRIVAEMTPRMRHWALSYLSAKYLVNFDGDEGEELPL